MEFGKRSASVLGAIITYKQPGRAVRASIRSRKCFITIFAVAVRIEINSIHFENLSKKTSNILFPCFDRPLRSLAVGRPVGKMDLV